jgi:hypothetical protein
MTTRACIVIADHLLPGTFRLFLLPRHTNFDVLGSRVANAPRGVSPTNRPAIAIGGLFLLDKQLINGLSHKS